MKNLTEILILLQSIQNAPIEPTVHLPFQPKMASFNTKANDMISIHNSLMIKICD